jgi:hypothetical protein
MLEKVYEEDKEFKAEVDREVKALTLRLIDGLNFSNNVQKIGLKA